MDNKTHIKELREKILLGLHESYKKLLESKRRNNGTIIEIKDGKIVRIKP